MPTFLVKWQRGGILFLFFIFITFVNYLLCIELKNNSHATGFYL